MARPGVDPARALPDSPALPPAPPRGLLIANLLAQLAFGLLTMTICIPSMQACG